MRKYLYLYFLLSSFLGFGQHYDSKWLLGYNSLSPNISDITEMTFTENTMSMQLKYLLPRFSVTQTSMCDNTGNMLFCTNGVYVYNKDYNFMTNTSGLNPSNYTNSNSGHGLHIPQGVIALPSPKQDNTYYLFHETLRWTNNFGNRPLELYYSVIDMNLENGLGKVVSKNNKIITDTLDIGQITACKHANGRDWWILVPRFSGEGYYRLLLSVEGVQNVGLQITGNYAPAACASQAVFSPDGTKYARYDQEDWTDTLGFLNIFDFDRCTGLLSNRQIITIPHLANWWGAAGVAISPNSKIAYVNDTHNIYQFDLTAIDIASTQYLVGTYDGYQSPFGSTFYQGQLAPDGKIYWSCTNGEDVLHVIDYPDSLGAACSFRQHGIQLLSYNSLGLPNHPNYYLGALSGSACDTLVSYQPSLSSEQVKVYPNPAQDRLTIEMSEGKPPFACVFYNMLGQKVYEQQLTQSATQVFVGNWAKGAYFYEVITLKEKIYGKVFIE